MTSTETSMFRKEASVSCLHGDPSSAVCSLLFAWTFPGKWIHLLGAPRYAFIPKLFPWEGRSRARSPVHLLLTTAPGELAAGPAASPEHSPAPGKVGSPEGAATAPQIGTSSPVSWSGHLHPLPVLFKQKVYSVINELSLKHSSSLINVLCSEKINSMHH